MPRRAFPEFKDRTEMDIKDYLQSLCYDVSYHSDYSIHYALLSPEDESWKGMKWSEIKSKWGGYVANYDACYGSLPGMLHRYARINKELPTHIAVSFSLEPFANGVENDDYWYDDEDDYPDYDSMMDLSKREVFAYCEWLFRNNIIPEFDIPWFWEHEVFVVPFIWKNINTAYFSLTMARYQHEGQNICRRIIQFDKTLRLDPYVNIVMAHWFANSNYNGGHCVCDSSFWRNERFDWNDIPDRVNCAQFYISRIARSMRKHYEDNTSDWDQYDINAAYGNGPYFEYEYSVAEYESALRTKTPKTWEGLCALSTKQRRRKHV